MGLRCRRFITRAGAIAVVAIAWLPRLAIIPAATGCQCPDSGSPVIFDATTVAKNPRIVMSGPACNAKSVECMRRDDQDRCDVFWIVPDRSGKCIFTAQFSDGTAIEDEINYVDDTKYPCRGNIRPADDNHVTRINSGT